ncbi:hypothetical protein T06_2950 [Trichinella sp. T6]|nr:hypothetical protein T06_2950 [Trichinella sp. T6]
MLPLATSFPHSTSPNRIYLLQRAYILTSLDHRTELTNERN